MAKTSIEWTDYSWNPIRGTKGKWHCTKVSPGCKNCYAERQNIRFEGPAYTVGTDTLRLDEKVLQEPLHWRRPRKVFVESMSDIFHDKAGDAQIDSILAVAALCPQHTFIILSKRPKRMASYLGDVGRPFAVQRAVDALTVGLSAEGDEEWRAAPGYVGIYEVSSRGRVRRSDNSRKGRRNREGLLAQRTTRGGYLAVCLSCGGVVLQARTNRLVLQAFAGPAPGPDAEARHINGVRTDNRSANLCWGTKSENMADASRHGTAGSWAKGRATLAPEQIAAIRVARLGGAKLADIAREYDATKQQISSICLEKTFKPADISWPLPNVWLGVSVENPDCLWRVEELLKIPAAKRFVSLEPMLGPVELTPWLNRCCCCGVTDIEVELPCGHKYCYICVGRGHEENHTCNPPEHIPAISHYHNLDWVICGGESGPGARPMHPDWVRSVRDQCVAAGVPFFFKGWGEWAPAADLDIDLLARTSVDSPKYHALPDGGGMIRVGKKHAGRILDECIWNEFPRAGGAA